MLLFLLVICSRLQVSDRFLYCYNLSTICYCEFNDIGIKTLIPADYYGQKIFVGMYLGTVYREVFLM